jgi:YbbR domain-containing protein
VTVDPLVVTVSGEASVVSLLQSAQTVPLDVTGRTSDLEAEVSLALPNGVTVSGTDTVRIMLSIEQETGTQTFGVGVALSGELAGYSYSVSPDHVNVTLGGPTLNLASLDPASLIATANVADLTPGTHTVQLDFVPPDGLDVVSLDPTEVTVTVAPPPSLPASVTP